MSDVVNRIEHLPPRILELLVRCTHEDAQERSRTEMINPRDRSGPCPLSYAQERLWFLDQLQPGNVAYNLPLLLPFGEEVELGVLERALNVIVARHESLRTTFIMIAGSPAQRVAPSLRLEVEDADLRGVDEPHQRLQLLIDEEAARPFDLSRGPLLRAKLLRVPGSALLLLNMHHIVSDGWSMGVLERELRAAYGALERGAAPEFGPLPIQYADYAAWQREWMSGERLEGELRHWRRLLGGAPPLLELPYDRPRPPVESYRGAVQTFWIAERTVAPLRELARERGATLFMVLLALFKALLARYGGRRDVVVATPVANRNRSELEDLIGFFVNMLVLRTEVEDGLSVTELVERVRGVTLEGYEHQEVPFERLVEGLGVRRSLSHGPLFQVCFVLQNTPRAEEEGEGEAWPEEGAGLSYQEGTAKFDLTLYLEERGGGLVGSCEYRTDLFGRETIGRMMRRYVQMLAAAGEDPDTPVCQLPIDAGDEPSTEYEEAFEPEPWLSERVAGLADAEGWDAAGLAVLGREVSARLYLGEASRLLLLDKGDRVVRLLGEAAAAASCAAVCFEEAGDISSASPTHILLTPEGLSALDPSEVGPEIVIAVVGLPWFAGPLAGWERHYVVGLWASASEGGLCCATLEMGEDEAVIHRPLPGCRVEVLDGSLRPQPVDIWGEVYAAGPAVAQQRRPEGGECAEDPCMPGGVLYRTGLIGRRRPDGRIEVAGAEARMTSIDGQRVDPLRLESLLRQHEGVEAAEVRVCGEGDEAYLAAWAVRRRARAQAGRTDARVSEAGLLRYVGERLTAGLVPRRLVVSDRLPDDGHAAAQEPEQREAEPRTAVEAVIARIWGEVLGSAQRDVRANFFDQGGNSVASVQVASRIREALRVELPLHRLFEAPTIAELAALVESDPAFSSASLEDEDTDKVESALERTCSLLDIQIKGLDEEGILDTVAALEDWEVEELLQRTLRQVQGSGPSGSAEAEQVSRLTDARRRSLLTKLLVNHFGPVRNCPLSYAQERLWFLDQLQPGNVAYNLPLLMPLHEGVELALLEQSLNVVVARHEALRTTFTMLGGSPVQRISPALHIGVEEVDLRAAPEAQQRLQTNFSEEAGRPFDLSRGPLLRARLLRVPGGALLLLNMHHIVSDGWSMGVLERELRSAYDALGRGETPALKELPIQYADYAAWQREWMSGERMEGELRHWRRLLGGAPPLLELPYDRPRPPVESYRGAVQTFWIPGRVVGPLREVAREHGATLFMVLLAVFKALLARYGGRRDVVVATPVANRNRSELEGLIGFFVNMLVLRTEVEDGLKVGELVERVRGVTLEGYEHQEVPFERLVEGLGVRRSLSHGPLFQVAFVLQNTPQADGWGGMAETPWGAADEWVESGAELSYQEGTAKFDLTLYLEERGGGLIGSCEYRTDLFERETIGRMMRRYVRLLQAAGADAELPVWQLPFDAEPEPERQVRSDSGAGGPEALGQEVAALLGLYEWSRLAVLDDGDEAVRLLGEAAAVAVGAEVWTGEEARATVTAAPAAEPTHILLTPEALAGLRPSDISPETVIGVVGLPWFAASLSGWEGRRLVGLWVSAEGPLCCATVEMDEVEAVIGEPLPGCWIEVLDERLRRQPSDLWGMIYVGGETVLHEQPTEERPGRAWVADPFEDGKRLYRTGLVGKRRADGRIEVVGAEERMVRVDGMRVDPARLESLLAQHRGVSEVRVSVLRDEDEPYLAACVVPRARVQKAEAGTSRQAPRVDEAGLLRYVGERLTAGLVPRRLAVADRLPDGDRWAAPEAEGLGAEPRTAVEAVIARIWGEVLGSAQRDVRANFFDQGGNSVASVQVASRIREALRVELPLHRLFEAPTIAELAALVESERAESLDGRDVGEAANTVPGEGAEVDSLPADKIRRAPPGPRRARAPLSCAQERLWFLDQFEPSSSLYNMSVTIRLEADADPKVVRRVLKEISARHETLRTSFPSLGRLPQQVIETVEPIPVPVTVLNDADPYETDAEVSRIVSAEAARPFDLARGPVMRARLIRAGERYSCLSLVIHHIVFDGWSFGILLREFWTLYRSFKEGKDSPLEELPVQYADFARWQRRWLVGEHFKPHMEYWRQQLAGAPEVLPLPYDRPRPRVETHEGATQWFSIPREEAAALRALSRAHDTTLFCVLLAAFKTLLMRLSNQEDVTVGSPIANRTRVEVEKLIGFFANTLALRTDLSGNPTFAELLKRVHRTCVAAAEHQEVPFEKIVEELQPARSLNHNPLFQVMLVLQNMPEGGEELREYVEAWQQAQRPDDDTEASVIHGTSKFDLTLTLFETEVGLAGNLEYSTDLFDHSTVARMIRQLRRVLAAVASDPHRHVWQVPLMTPAEESELTRALGGPEEAAPSDETVRGLFEITAQETPSAPALVFGERVFSYGELNAAANRLARRLRRLGVTPGGRVAISMPRSPETLVAVLAALKAGAAYVPVDPSYPEARRSIMLAESRASLLVCRPQSGVVAPEGMRVLDSILVGDESAPEEPEDDLEVPIGADSPAYVIFTSGSTGRPKGVVMRHGALANLIRWQAANCCELPRARTLQFTSLSFDVSFQELFLTWSTGGTLVLIDEETRSDPEALWRSLCEHGVERLFMPYVALQQLAETALSSELPLPPLREVITAGEQLRITPAIAALFERLETCVLRNQYGPTETHVVTEYVLEGHPDGWPSLPPIGKPITNAAVRILDRHLNPVPVGVSGEVYLAGECLALGYLERPGQTADRFLPDRWGAAPGARMYRTGDLGRVCADGNVEFLGRADQQVKVRGYRIEPGEIELTLTQLPEVEEAAVVALGDSGSDRRLVAFIRGRIPADGDTDSVREALARLLPEYMVPSLVVALERMPLTPSGKIDRQALMRSTPIPSRSRVSFEPPSTPLERMLTEHWAELLGIEQVGVNDTFFSLGGHSLLATRVMSRIRSAIGLQLPVRSLFEAPTIRQLARVIAQHLADRVSAAQSEELLNRLSQYSAGHPQTSSPLTA